VNIKPKAVLSADQSSQVNFTFFTLEFLAREENYQGGKYNIGQFPYIIYPV
jgi:hypothetical protein